jgi:hypothetical protein
MRPQGVASTDEARILIPSSRELFSRFENANRCNRLLAAGSKQFEPASPLSHSLKSFSARTGILSFSEARREFVPHCSKSCLRALQGNKRRRSDLCGQSY